MLRLILFSLAALPSIGRTAWDAVPSVSLGVQSNNNVTRRLTAKQSATRSVLDAGVTLSSFNERGNIFFTPRVVADSYADSDQSQYESEDVFLRSGGRYAWQNVTAGFRADYSEVSVLRAEFIDATLVDPDLEDPVDDTTGHIEFVDEQRERLLYGGNLNFSLSQRSQLQLDLSRSEVSYSRESSGTSRTGFDNTSLAMGLARQLSERSNVSARVRVSQFNANRNGNTTDTAGLEATFSRALSELWRLNLDVGVQNSSYDFLEAGTQNVVSSDATTASVGVGLRKRSERSTWNFSVARVITPNATGFLTERTRARAFLRQQFTERFSGQFGVLLANSAPLDDLDPREERDYARVQVGFDWLMTQTVLLEFGVDAFRQKFGNEDPRTTTANSAYVRISYRGLSRAGQ